MAFRLPITFALVLAFAAVALGQRRVVTLQPVDVAGSIAQMGPASIAVTAANGRTWILKLQPGTTKIKITGTAEPEMLTQGTSVRFTARIDKRTSKAQDKIGAITIFTPTQGVTERTLGVELASEHPQGNVDDANAPLLPPEAAAGTGTLDDGAGGKSPKKRPPAAKGPDKSVPDVANYDVCAEIVSNRNGHMVVSVQNRFLKPRITVDLAADARIDLDLGDLSLAKPGDKIQAEGFYAVPGTCEEVDSVEVALSNPLAPPGSRPRRPRPVAGGGDTAPRPAGKAKTGPETAAGKKASPGAATPDKAPAKEAQPQAPATDLPLAKDNPPASAHQTVEPDPSPAAAPAPPVQKTSARPEETR